jgi:hypothetical protein
MTWLTMRELREASGARPAFLVAGLVHAAVTLVIGREKAGKSRLVAAVVAHLERRAGETFLEMDTTAGPHSIWILTVDGGGAEEWRARLAGLGVSDDSSIRIAQVTSGDFADHVAEAVAAGATLLVVDHLTGLVPADAKTNEATGYRGVTDPLTAAVNSGVTVLAIAHKAKTGVAHTALGTPALGAWARWQVDVSGEASGRLKLRLTGNAAPPGTLRVALDDIGHPALLAAPESAAERPRRNRGNDPADLATVAQLILSDAGARKSLSAAARALRAADRTRWASDGAARKWIERHLVGTALSVDPQTRRLVPAPD